MNEEDEEFEEEDSLVATYLSIDENKYVVNSNDGVLIYSIHAKGITLELNNLTQKVYDSEAKEII